MQTLLIASFEALTGLPEFIAYLFIGVVGACIGSFLNVVIYRVPNKKSLLPSSKCPNCEQAIKPWHNVPILGWLMLGGNVRTARSRSLGDIPQSSC